MGLARRVVCCSLTTASAAVALLAVCIGLLMSGAASQLGLWTALDGKDELKGIIPASHAGKPWGFSLAQMPDLEGELFVVTGGNIGLGYWTARHLASRQAAVVLACRSLDRCEPAAAEIRAETGNPHGAVCMEMDLASFASVRSFARSFSEMAEQTGVVISGLILNAGVMVPPFGLTEDGLETQIGVNHFGHFLLASLLRPSLEAAAASRLGVATVVVVSSNAHYNSYDEGIRPLEELNNEASYDRGKAYGQSKLANVLFAQELAERAGPSGILVNAVHPGAVETNLGRNLESAIQATLGGAALDWLKQHVLPTSERGLWHPKDASLTALYAAVSDEVRKGKVTGKYFHPIARPTTPHAHARNGTLQNWLWGVTEDYLAAH